MGNYNTQILLFETKDIDGLRELAATARAVSPHGEDGDAFDWWLDDITRGDLVRCGSMWVSDEYTKYSAELSDDREVSFLHEVFASDPSARFIAWLFGTEMDLEDESLGYIREFVSLPGAEVPDACERLTSLVVTSPESWDEAEVTAGPNSLVSANGPAVLDEVRSTRTLVVLPNLIPESFIEGVEMIGATKALFDGLGVHEGSAETFLWASSDELSITALVRAVDRFLRNAIHSFFGQAFVVYQTAANEPAQVFYWHSQEDYTRDAPLPPRLARLALPFTLG